MLEVYVLIVYYEDTLFGDKNPRDFNQKGVLFIRGTDNHIVTQKFMSDPDELWKGTLRLLSTFTYWVIILALSSDLGISFNDILIFFSVI